MHFLRVFHYSLLLLFAFNARWAQARGNWEQLLTENNSVRWLSENSPHLKSAFEAATETELDRLGPTRCDAVLRSQNESGQGRAESLYQRLLFVGTQLGGSIGPGQLRRAAKYLLVDPASSRSRWTFLPEQAFAFAGAEDEIQIDLFAEGADPYSLAQLAVLQWKDQEDRFKRLFVDGPVTLSSEAQILSVGATYKQLRLAVAAVLEAYLSASSEKELRRVLALALEMERERIKFPLDHFLQEGLRFRVSRVKALHQQAVVVLRSMLVSTAKE